MLDKKKKYLTHFLNAALLLGDVSSGLHISDLNLKM